MAPQYPLAVVNRPVSYKPVSSQRQHWCMRSVVQVIRREARAAERCGEAGGVYPDRSISRGL